MNRRYFFNQLAGSLLAVAAPTLFLPKIIKPEWKPTLYRQRILLEHFEERSAGVFWCTGHSVEYQWVTREQLREQFLADANHNLRYYETDPC
jgi:hypothetical protein